MVCLSWSVLCFGGEQDVEVVGDALPGFGQIPFESAALVRVASRVFTRVWWVSVAVGLLLLQPVAEGHKFIDFGDDAMLFLK